MEGARGMQVVPGETTSAQPELQGHLCASLGSLHAISPVINLLVLPSFHLRCACSGGRVHCVPTVS